MRNAAVGVSPPCPRVARSADSGSIPEDDPSPSHAMLHSVPALALLALVACGGDASPSTSAVATSVPGDDRRALTPAQLASRFPAEVDGRRASLDRVTDNDRWSAVVAAYADPSDPSPVDPRRGPGPDRRAEPTPGRPPEGDRARRPVRGGLRRRPRGEPRPRRRHARGGDRDHRGLGPPLRLAVPGRRRPLHGPRHTRPHPEPDGRALARRPVDVLRGVRLRAPGRRAGLR